MMTSHQKSKPKIPAPTNHPFMDIYHTDPFMGIKRGVVFNAEQARFAFAEINAPIVLCVDGSVCKWIECVQQAVGFFDPPTHFKCDCGFEAIDRPPKDHTYLCHECKAPMVSTNLGELRKRVAQLAAGDL